MDSICRILTTQGKFPAPDRPCLASKWLMHGWNVQGHGTLWPSRDARLGRPWRKNVPRRYLDARTTFEKHSRTVSQAGPAVLGVKVVYAWLERSGS